MNLPPDFESTVHAELAIALSEIGYCLNDLDTVVLNDTSKREELLIYMTSETTVVPDDPAGQNLLISLLQIKDLISGNTKIAYERPMISIVYQPEELSSFQSVLVKKVVENIRTQYVCHLRIQSNPGNILITTNTGLEGKTPLEWIIPVGNLTIKNITEGYEPFQKKLDLNVPGIHTYFLELKKKQFYNSKFFIPSIILTLTSAACFIGEQYYYSQYHDLGEDDMKNNPDKFAKTFKTAQNYETATYISLACAAVSFSCTFFIK